jgi:hypothetical protein
MYKKSFYIFMIILKLGSFNDIMSVYKEPGAQKLTGENPKVVWAEFSTLSLAVLLLRKKYMLHTHDHI